MDGWNAIITGAALGVIIIIIGMSRRQMPLLAASVTGWFLGAFLVSRVGFFTHEQAFTAADTAGFLAFGTLMSLPVIAFAAAYMRSAALRAWLEGIPTHWLIGVQVYRVVGVVFLWLTSIGRMPVEVGLPTGIADLTVGLVALPLAYAYAQGWPASRAAALGWNIFGLADFAVAIGGVSLAMFGLVALSPAPALIGLFPLALISLVQVPISIVLHGLVLLRLMRAATPATAPARI